MSIRVTIPDSLISPALLADVRIPTEMDVQFCIGLPEFYICTKCKEIRSPAKKKLKLSLSSARASTSNARFAEPLPDERMKEISKGKRSVSTLRSTSRAVTVYREWISNRNLHSTDKCPEDFLELQHSRDVVRLEKWLCLFVVEARKQDGNSYPPSTIQSLLSGILRHMRELHTDTPDFLSKKDHRFRALKGTIESTYSELRKNGVGAEVKHTPIVTKEEEEMLWSKKVMGVDLPRQLQRTIFFYVGKVFCLRGGVEQRALKPSQFQRRHGPDHYVYIENGSKNNPGTTVRVENKVVPVYRNQNSGRCVVSLLDKYLSKLPPAAFKKDIFYLRPKPLTPVDKAAPWYEETPTLRTMFAKMCSEAGIEKKSNHSLRATGATEMFAANVPEKLIQSRTGHRSLEALRLYERPTQEQQQAVSNVLTGRSVEPRMFGRELSNVQLTGTSHSRSANNGSQIPALPQVCGTMNNCIVANCPETSGTVPDLGLSYLSRTES